MTISAKLSHYISEMDQFLKSYDHSHPNSFSQSQLKEMAKYKRIYQLRDKAEREDEKTDPFSDLKG